MDVRVRKLATIQLLSNCGRSRELKIVLNFQYDTKLVARGSWKRETVTTTISGRRRKTYAPPVVTKSFQWNYVSIGGYARPLTGRARINNTAECWAQSAETITCEKERIAKNGIRFLINKPWGTVSNFFFFYQKTRVRWELHAQKIIIRVNKIF